jgi:hypothetical protein
MRELMVGYIRHIQESGETFSLLLDCLEMGAQPNGSWMERIIKLKALQLYEADGKPHSFPGNMQAAITKEAFDERYRRIAALRMADKHVLVRRDSGRPQ